MGIDEKVEAASEGEADEDLARIRSARPPRPKKNNSATQKRYLLKLQCVYALNRAKAGGVDVLGLVEELYPLLRRKAGGAIVQAKVPS
jgi:hypothetical protein